MKTGEMLELQAQAWTPLPEAMQQGRWNFNPCVYQRDIYLCGGCTTTIELFSLVTRCFQLHPSLRLPEESPCVACSGPVAFDDSLYWVSSFNRSSECVRARREGGVEIESYKA